MKSLDKVFDIMELVVGMGGQSVSPGTAAKLLNLNAATCVRFMKYLCKRGYLEQVSRKEGYVLGPAGLTFTDRQSKYSKLIEASEEPVKKLADRLNNYINISVLYNATRYLLYMYSSHTRKTSGAQRIKFSYNVATSRLLLSACDEKTRDEIIALAGMPGASWDNINDRETLLKALARIRRDACTSFPDPDSGQWIIGGLVIANDFPAAAIGFGIDGDDPTEALRLTREAVKEIENNLNRKEIVF
jgi:DNA-binding IclR family transcriptional regulator